MRKTQDVRREASKVKRQESRGVTRELKGGEYREAIRGDSRYSRIKVLLMPL